MKTLSLALFSLVLFSIASNAQNWNVFNPGYRYNYKYNHSQLVSQVLFVDSTKTSGSDSIYYMNRIGVVNSGVFSFNMPQFLQRSIRKFGNGLVMLYDTSKLVINPACQPGQTWLFDSIANMNALCLAKNGRNTFGLSDTVKTIVVGTQDTVKLSKHFGILQFPDLYNKNKYYRLAGVELAASYDSVPFYGERVPNAWDIYDFNAGDRFCISDDAYSKNVGYFGYNENFSVKKKNIIPNGYSYDVEGARDAWTNLVHPAIPVPPAYNSFTYNAYHCGGLSSPALPANSMYPGQMITQPFPYFSPYNIVSFGLDDHGIFYKFSGKHCLPASSVIFPFNDMNTYVSTDIYQVMSDIYGVGLGRLTHKCSSGPSGVNYKYDYESLCMTCAVKAGNLYFGTETSVGINEQQVSQNGLRLYPNPVKEILTVELGDIPAEDIRISNVWGETVFQRNVQNDQTVQIPVSDWQSGIYLVQLFNKDGLLSSKKIVRN